MVISVSFGIGCAFATVFVKFLLQSALNHEYRGDYKRDLEHRNDKAQNAQRIIACTVKRYVYQCRYNKHYHAKLPPDPAARLMRKFPCLFVFHREGSSIAYPIVYIFRCAPCHKYPCHDHNQRDKNIANENKPPKPHIQSPINQYSLATAEQSNHRENKILP